jgi:glycosyltransferase involved in cell wall biosynthesis
MHALAREFLRRGYNVTVCAPVDGVDAPQSFESQGIRIISHPRFFTYGPRLRQHVSQLFDPVLYIHRLRRFLAARPGREVPDLVLTFSFLYAAAAKKAWPGVPVAYLSGGACWDCYSWLYGGRKGWVRVAFLLKKVLGVIAEHRALRLADKTFVEVNALTRRLEHFHFGIDSKIEVLPTPVDVARFGPSLERRQQIRRELGIAEDARVILGVGRLQWNKNYGNLVRAVARLQPRNWCLLIVGQGEERRELEELARTLHVDDRTRFLGNRADMESVYAGAHIFAHPAVLEPYGNVILEAMASGLPCVVSPGEYIGISSQLSHGVNALLANPRDPQDWSDKIGRLLADPGLAERLGREARSFCEQCGSWPSFADDVLRGLGIRRPNRESEQNS